MAERIEAPGGAVRTRTWPRALDRLLDTWVGRAVDWTVAFIVAGLVAMVLSGVLSRYVVNYSLAWTDELAGLLFVWLTMLGSVAALRRRSHMAIGFFPRLFGPRGQRRVGLYATSAVVLFLLFMIIEGITLTRATLSDRSPVLELRIGLYYLSLPVCGSLMLAYALRQLAAVWRSEGGWQASAESEED